MVGTGPVRVLTERIMSRGFEPAVVRMMERVKATVSRQPGLISVETMADMDDHHKYVVLSEWKSRADYDKWQQSEDFKQCTAKLNDLLDTPGKKTRVFQRPKEDIFLL
ncbi:monooxygenase [Thraustotheca clavata]|uniref:Monooxygenase n=1 Tax=Thraustotheca clavata TaxID=74557 RepID=A0A1W0A5Y2_9STRA|nr:monooxygenase [Thraustotheca clavata]